MNSNSTKTSNKADKLIRIKSADQLNDQSLKIVENVLHHCKCEALRNWVFREQPISYLERVSLYTGLPKPVIKAIKERPCLKVKDNDITLWLEIRKVLKNFYSRQDQPTSEIVYNLLRARSFNIPNIELFEFQLFELGYKNILLLSDPTPGEMIMENPKVTFERYCYIKQIMKARTMNKKIYYLSVKVFNTDKKCMVPFKFENLEKVLPQAQLLFLYHIVSKDGYEDGLFTHDPNQLINWVLKIVIPLLKPSSLIILDKSTHNGKPKNRHNISRYHPKRDMMKWLKSHNLPCELNMHKAELFKLIEKCSVKLENTNIENFLKSMGHMVLYLPEIISDLISPVELFWKELNKKLKFMKKDGVLKEFIAQEISSTSSQSLWAKYDGVIKKNEEDIFALDAEIENYLDKYELDLDCIKHYN